MIPTIAIQAVAIQGIRASFHDVAARGFFGAQYNPLECLSFSRLADALIQKECDRAVMAIENSIAGSILPNYSLLERHQFRILGEIYLRISHSLLALPGQKLSDLHSVQSHPMALHQISDFLARHTHLRAQESPDTAESSKRIAQEKLQGWGAIAHESAGEVYGLNVLERAIENDPSNYTRFLVICRLQDYQRPHNANKASIRFETPHRSGALAKVLQVFSQHAVNLTKIQSVPIVGRPYEYSFHVDLEWDDFENYIDCMKQIQERVVNLIHFGDYPKGSRDTVLQGQQNE